MSLTRRWVSVGLVLVLAGRIGAQSIPEVDLPARHTPRVAASRQDLDRREAQRLYGVAVLHERGNRLVEAVRAYEEAQKLDPESAAIPRALAGLYLTLDRTDDALAAFQRALKLDPDDGETAFGYARQLRGLERWKEAITALELATRSSRFKERPDLAAQAWFDLGVLQEQAKEWGRAEEALRRAVALLDHPEGFIESGRYSREEVNSQAAETLERLGRVCLQAKRIDAAVQAFEAAKKKDSQRAPRLAYNLAQVLRDQGKPREALEQVNLYLQSQPQAVDGYEMKIALQRQLRRDRDVLPQLEVASARDPHNAGLKLLLAKEYRAARRAGEARQVYLTLLETNLSPEVYRGLFGLLRDQGPSGVGQILSQLDAAMRKAVRDDNTPKDAGDARRARAMLIVLREDPALVRQLLPAAILRARDRRGDGLHRATRGMLATLAARTKQLPQAEQLYRSCLERPTGGSLEHEAYAGLLRVLEMQRKYAAVIEVGKEGLRTAQMTNRVLFHLYMVNAYQHLDDHKAALAAADLAVTEAGKDEMPMARRTRVHALIQAGEHAKALAECQELIKEYNTKSGELRDARYSLSNVLQAMGKLDEAEEQLQLILRADPNDATANNDLGYLWADRGKKLPEAERLIRKALELDRQQRTSGAAVDADSDKDNAAYVDSLGWVLFRLGKLNEAREQLEKAAALAGGEDDPVMWDHLGDVCFRQEDTAKAVENWKKALSLYEQGARRKTDGRYREIQEKIRQAKP
jgi:tetratricopeptide (TPR) repeat protein